MEFYRCDWCKKEIAEKPIHLRNARVQCCGYRTINIDLCEECFNKLFSEHIPMWKKENEEKANRYAKRKAEMEAKQND